MSFFSKALRRAEVFLEQVDESVAQASRRLVVEGAVGDVEDSDYSDTGDGDDSSTTARRSKVIPRAKRRALKRSRSRTSVSSASELKENDNSDGNEVESKSNLKETDDVEEKVGESSEETKRENSGDRQLIVDGNVESKVEDISEADANAWGADFDIEEENPMEKSAKIDEGDQEKEERLEDSSLTESKTDKAIALGAEQKDHTVTDDTNEAELSKSKESQQNERRAHDQGVTVSQTQEDVKSTTTKAKSEVNETFLAAGNNNVDEKHATSSKTPSEGEDGKVQDANINTMKKVHDVHREGEEVDGEFVEALEAENDALRDELEAIETELSSLKAERSKLVKNLKRMKEVTFELDESLREKSSDARKLQSELNAAKDAAAVLRAEKERFEGQQKKKADKLDAKLRQEIEELTSRLMKAEATCETLTTTNAEMQEKLTLGRVNDAATADDARKEADSALSAYEAEVQRHLKTREEAQAREAELENKAALATSALAAAKRSAEEFNVATTQTKSRLRTIESQLRREVEARDAALARIVDLEKIIEDAGIRDGVGIAQRKNNLDELQETVQELENALESKNVELARLKAECEVMRKESEKPKNSTADKAVQTQETNALVEKQLRTLADQALRKQSELESLRGENRALAHQLDMERKRTREAQAMAAAQHSIRGGVRGILDMDVERGVREGPMARLRIPRRWPKSVEKVLRSLDLVTTRILLVMRKEPLIRLAFLLYVGLTNLFVVFVLHWHVGASVQESEHVVEHGVEIIDAAKG